MNFVEPIRDRADIEAIKQVLRAGSERDWLLFTAGVNLGLRISDLLRLRVRDVRGKKYIILVEQKTKKRKKMPIRPEMRPVFKRYIAAKDDRVFLFPSRNGVNKPLTRGGAYLVLKKAADKLGLPSIGTHTLRKTFGYHMYRSNKNIGTLMKIFNHTHPSVTMRYIGIEDDDIEAAVNEMEMI